MIFAPVYSGFQQSEVLIPQSCLSEGLGLGNSLLKEGSATSRESKGTIIGSIPLLVFPQAAGSQLLPQTRAHNHSLGKHAFWFTSVQHQLIE